MIVTRLLSPEAFAPSTIRAVRHALRMTQAELFTELGGTVSIKPNGQHHAPMVVRWEAGRTLMGCRYMMAWIDLLGDNWGALPHALMMRITRAVEP